MKMVCALRGHSPGPETCNAGTCFARCTRCGEDLVQQGGQWTPVPKGYRLVWRAAGETEKPGAATTPEAAVRGPEEQGAAPPSDPPFMLGASLAEKSHAEETTILVCDDDQLVSELVRHKLESQGWKVLLAGDGQQGIALLEARPVDLVVLDAMMPRMDGYEVLRRIPEDARWADLPVVMLTARGQETDVLAGLGLGADEYMVKPFSGDELVSRISRLLRRREIQARSRRSPLTPAGRGLG